AGSGVNSEAAWSHFLFWHAEGMLLYHLIAIHGFLYAPFYGWLMLVSGGGERLPVFWGAVPIFAVGVFGKSWFNTSDFVEWLGFQAGGGSRAIAVSAMSMDALTSPSPGEFLLNGGLWINLLIAAMFFALAIRLRRQRGPI